MVKKDGVGLVEGSRAKRTASLKLEHNRSILDPPQPGAAVYCERKNRRPRVSRTSLKPSWQTKSTPSKAIMTSLKILKPRKASQEL